MAFLVLMLGLFSVALGFVMIGFGIPINEFGLGNTLIGAGVTSLVGGLILFGLAAAVRQLERISQGLAARRLSRTARTSDIQAPPIPLRNGPRLPQPPRPLAPDLAPERREPRVGSASPVSFSTEAIERMRSNIPRLDRASENAPAGDHDVEAPLSPAQGVPFPMPRPVPVDRTDASVEGDVRTRSRLAFPWRSKAGAGVAPRGQFDQQVFEADRPSTTADEATTAQSESAAPDAAIEPVADAEQPVAILKSGVVDGMAYTLYADGSIEAKLPEGTVRFGSITELRSHLEQHA